MASDAKRIREAAARYGRTVDHVAAQYTNPITGRRLSGEALLLKVAQGESGALTDPTARRKVSSAGARAWMQFTAGTRAGVISKYGIDPWRSPEEAVHAAALHLRGKVNGTPGLEGYNPGSASYPTYILRQRVGHTMGRGGVLAHAAGRGGAPAATEVPIPGFNAGAAQSLSAVLAGATRPILQSAGLQTPDFAASAPTPKGYQPLQSGGVTKPAIDDQQLTALSQAVSFGTPQPSSSQPGGGGGGGGGGGAPSGRRGEVTIQGPQPGRVVPHLVRILERVAGQSQRHLAGPDGSSHDKMTTNGNVSEHYTGHAFDIFSSDGRPVVGRENTRIGRAALVAAGWSKERARRAGPGLYNVPQRGGGRIQIIFGTNSAALGGNHTDHVHVGWHS